MTDLDLACALLNEARHVLGDSQPRTRLREHLEPIMFGPEAGRLVRAWEQRKRAAADPTPAPVLIHQHNLEHAQIDGPELADTITRAYAEAYERATLPVDDVEEVPAP